MYCRYLITKLYSLKSWMKFFLNQTEIGQPVTTFDTVNLETSLGPVLLSPSSITKSQSKSMLCSTHKNRIMSLLEHTGDEERISLESHKIRSYYL